MRTLQPSRKVAMTTLLQISDQSHLSCPTPYEIKKFCQCDVYRTSCKKRMTFLFSCSTKKIFLLILLMMHWPLTRIFSSVMFRSSNRECFSTRLTVMALKVALMADMEEFTHVNWIKCLKAASV